MPAGMKTAAQPDSNDAATRAARPDLAVALDQLWVRFLPEIRGRVSLLEAAATACCAGKQLSTAQREGAHAAAHKLAGTLGTFNLARGTVLARECELLFFGEEALDSTIGEQLASMAVELRAVIESRK